MATRRPAATGAAPAPPADPPHHALNAGRPRWQHDREAVVCGECRAPFTTARRKHHCRACGRIFCERCVRLRLLVPGDAMARPRRQPATALAPLELDPRSPQRVCPPCAEELVGLQEELRRTVSRASQRHLLSRRTIDRYMNPPLMFSMESEIKKAAYTLYNFTADSLEGRDAVPRELIWGAKGLAFLTMVKAGMFLTARMGSGLVIGRLPDDYEGDRDSSGGGGNESDGLMRREGRAHSSGLPRWSAPSAITCSGVGYGFQMGCELIDVVIILNTASALEAFASSTQVAIGTELSISLGPVGRTAATDLHAGRRGVMGAAFAYGQSKGLFLGVSLEGTVLLSRPALNREFYGKSYSTHELLLGQVPPPRAAEPLYQALDEVLGGGEAGAGDGQAALGAEHAESTWHGYLARHTRHRRHHLRRRDAEAAAAAAAAAADAGVGTGKRGGAVGGAEREGPGADVCCMHMGAGVGEGDDDDAEEEGETTAPTARRRQSPAPPDDAWVAERARRLQQSREQEVEERNGEGVVAGAAGAAGAAGGGGDPLLQRKEMRTYKTTAVFGPAKRAEEASGRVGPGPGHKEA